MEEPASVAEAREAVGEQTKVVTRMMVGVVLAVAFMLGFAVADVKMGAVAMVFVQLAWMLGHMIPLFRMQERLTSARSVLQAWDARSVAARLDAELPEPLANPEDPRWEALEQVMLRVRKLGDAHAQEVTEQAADQLREWMADLASLEEALATEVALGESPRSERLRGARDAKSARIDQVVESIRDLHVELAVREVSAASPLVDELEGLLRVAEAEAEVEEAGARARRASQTSG